MILPFVLSWCWFYQRRNWQLLFSILPVVSVFSMFGQELPGEGEHWLAFQNNWFLWHYYEPLHWLFPLFMMRFLQRREWSIFLWGSTVFLLCNHAVMASFNDFASRHLLVAIVPISFMLAPYFKNRIYWGIMLIQLMALSSFATIFYADQQDFQTFLREEYPDLPHYSIEEARERNCAWIAEVEPFISDEEPKILSHFNLLDRKEREDLRKQYLCIDWCFTEQDWQWSSLGIRDRAIRLTQLFALKEIGIVRANELECLLYSVREK